MAEVLIEGLAPEALLALPREELEALVLNNRPVVFRAGSAQILGQFGVSGSRLIIELAHIDGGGEGVLPTIGVLAHRYARLRAMNEVEWIVHAVHCAKPNLKLRRVLDRRGFKIEVLDNGTDAYHLIEPVGVL